MKEQNNHLGKVETRIEKEVPPRELQKDVYLKIHNLKQNDMNVKEYTTKFLA